MLSLLYTTHDLQGCLIGWALLMGTHTDIHRTPNL